MKCQPFKSWVLWSFKIRTSHLNFHSYFHCHPQEHLASRGFIHRDLAARNILLCEGRVVKIADFGLLRHTRDGGIYEVQHTKKMPIRWTAPEALQNGIFTSKSDV